MHEATLAVKWSFLWFWWPRTSP